MADEFYPEKPEIEQPESKPAGVANAEREKPRDERWVPWTLLDLFIIFGLTFILVYCFSVVLLKATGGLHLTRDMKEVVFGLLNTLVQDGLLLFLSIYIVWKKYRFSLKQYLLRMDRREEVIANGVVGGVAILFGVMMVNVIMAVILQTVFKMLPPQQEIIGLLLKTKNILYFLSYTVLIVLVAPVVEEVFFRGLVYSFFRGKYGVKVAMVISAAFFAMMHMSAWAFVGTFIGGLGLAYLFERSKSLYTSIIAHMVWNGIVTFFLYFVWMAMRLRGTVF